MPPLPKKFREAPDNEEVDSESELPPAQSSTADAAEASDGQTRKRSWSESLDASNLPTPRGPSFLERHGKDDGAYSTLFPAVLLCAMVPQPPAKKKKKEKEKAPPIFNLSDIDSHSSVGSLSEGAQEAVGESKLRTPQPQMVANSKDDAPNPSPREARVVITQKTAHGTS